MCEVKSTPLGGRHLAEYWMFGNRLARRESALAFGDEFIHANQIAKDFGNYLLDRRAARHYQFWRLSSGRKKTQACDCKALPPLRTAAGWDKPLTLSKPSLQRLDGAEVSEIQVLKDLRGAPLAIRTSHEVLDTGSTYGGGNTRAQFRHLFVHAGQ